MNIELSPFQLQAMLEQAAELGAIVALVKIGKLRPYLKKSEAFRQFGRTNIEHWIESGLITPRKDGNNSAAWRIERLEVEVISRSIYLLRYL